MSERKKRWKPGSDFLSSAAAIWMVPLLALFIGLWMLFQHWYSQGPSFTLTVATAEGIVAGKTVIRSREVDVGRIEAVELSDDYSHAVLKGRRRQRAVRWHGLEARVSLAASMTQNTGWKPVPPQFLRSTPLLKMSDLKLMRLRRIDSRLLTRGERP